MITGFHIRINYEKYTLFRYFITCLLQYTVIYGTRHSDRAFNYHIYTIVLKINNNKIFITISSKSTAKDSLADFSSLYREYSSMKWNSESLYAMIFEKKKTNDKSSTTDLERITRHTNIKRNIKGCRDVRRKIAYVSKI